MQFKLIICIVCILIALTYTSVIIEIIPPPSAPLPYNPRTVTFLIKPQLPVLIFLNNVLVEKEFEDVIQNNRLYHKIVFENLQRDDQLKIVDSATTEILYLNSNMRKNDEVTVQYIGWYTQDIAMIEAFYTV